MAKEQIREKINENFKLLENNFNNGIKEYKNFREICSILQIDYSKASSDSKTFILNELNRYCICGHKEKSHKFVITDIYIKPNEPDKKSRNYHSIYADTFYYIIVKFLHDKSDLKAIINNEIVIDRYFLFNLFGLTNDWFYKPKELNELDEDIYNELRDNIFEIAYQGFKRGLDYLLRKQKITYTKCSLIRCFNGTSFETRPADIDEENIINCIKQQIQQQYSCNSEHAFVQEYGFDLYKEQINKELEKDNFEYLSSVYRIALINDTVETAYNKLYGNIGTNELNEIIHEKRLNVNKKVLAQLPAKHKYEYNSAYTHSTFRGHNYNERKNNIQSNISKKIRKETNSLMSDNKKMFEYYCNKRNELAKQIIEIN